MTFELPPGLSAADEGRHTAPKGAEDLLFGDTLWLSVVDPNANIFGIAHFHLTNQGYARFETYFIIDGVQQCYGMRIPLDPEPTAGPWSDGRLRYEVVKPFEHIRVQLDTVRYGFDLHFTGRFAPFDYHDGVRGDPLAKANKFHGGHFEQAMNCKGTFEIRGGPAKGDVRQIDCWSHRDHSWSDRFSSPPNWDWPAVHIPSHFWPSIQLPDRHINVFGSYMECKMDQPNETAPLGGFVSDSNGSRPMLNAAAELIGVEGPSTREATAFRYQLTLPDSEVIHVRSTKHHGTIKLWNRGADNELENCMDCYEAFVDYEVEETGEVGTGVAEWTVYPPWPRWLV